MKLGIIGDVHGNTGRLLAAVATLRKHGAELTVCAGDLGVGFSDRERFAHEVNASGLDATILGNHDEVWLDGYNDRWAEYGLKPVQLRRGEPWTLPDGTVLLPMGGGESHDLRGRREWVDWWRGEGVRPADIERALDGPAPDIVLSHTLPLQYVFGPLDAAFGGIYPYDTFGHSEGMLDVLFDEYEAGGRLPKFWVAGHWHRYYASDYCGVRFHVLDRVDRREPRKGCIILIDTKEGTVACPRLEGVAAATGRGYDDGREQQQSVFAGG